jgi:hypothetical protein
MGFAGDMQAAAREVSSECRCSAVWGSVGMGCRGAGEHSDGKSQ